MSKVGLTVLRSELGLSVFYRREAITGDPPQQGAQGHALFLFILAVPRAATEDGSSQSSLPWQKGFRQSGQIWARLGLHSAQQVKFHVGPCP